MHMVKGMLTNRFPAIGAALAALVVLLAISAVPAQEPETLYVRITRPSVKVRKDYSPRSPMIGVAESGQRFRLLDYTQDAYKIAYGSSDEWVEGWIDRDHATQVKTTSALTAFMREHGRLLLLVGMAVVGGVILVVLLVLFVRSRVAKAAARVAADKELLIVAQEPKEIRYSLSNATWTIEKCFSELGFSISRVRSLENFWQRLKSRRPDVILADWKLSPDTADEVEIALSEDPRTASVPVVYYDVPPEVPQSRRPRVKNVYYLGTEISDRDLFSIIQSHTLGVTHTSIVRKADESSAIEGDIGEGGLSSVLQLVEIGQKNGCLLIRQEKPYGMIFFENGNPVYAATKSTAGEKAIYELLDLKTGHFRFAGDKKPPERNCATSTMGVLMEWSRVKDESTRD
ncbi:MAG: DUF4388 domain-containing protein [Chitinivibrionales bacterium]|nr:DUF4388 domain-containing protein [Chitinivibrionales bacterium]